MYKNNFLRKLDRLDIFFYSLSELEQRGGYDFSKIPKSVKILIESLLRMQGHPAYTQEQLDALARWTPTVEKRELPYMPTRVLLQDFTGVPCVVDLAALRSAMQRAGKNAEEIEPLIPVDLVIDHSVQLDSAGCDASFEINVAHEFERNKERYAFLKWGQQAFKTLRVLPPGLGICHQINMEYLANCVATCEGKSSDQNNGTSLPDTFRIAYPDTLVGTDSHTTTINCMGVLGWGVGGIEAEAALLGQPIPILTPEVIGFELNGKLSSGVTATDLALTVTHLLREKGVVGKFVEFYGEGAANLSLADRCPVANMSPEYGATMGFFAIDEKTIDYLRETGRSDEQCELVETYCKAQGLWGFSNEANYTDTLTLDLTTVVPVVAGPRKPHECLDLSKLQKEFQKEFGGKNEKELGVGRKALGVGRWVLGVGRWVLGERRWAKGVGHWALGVGCWAKGVGRWALGVGRWVLGERRWAKGVGHWALGVGCWAKGVGRWALGVGRWVLGERRWAKGVGRPATDNQQSTPNSESRILTHGSVVIASITSCTNTSNPRLVMGAGLVAKKAVEKGMKIPVFVKTSLAPGSQVVTKYLNESGLMTPLEHLGFHLVAYGCATCIGNSGPCAPEIDRVIIENKLTVAAVLSGNRNFEGRIYPLTRSNYLASPPLVVAYALAGTVDIDLTVDPIGKDNEGKDVFLKDIWYSEKELDEVLQVAANSDYYKKVYADVFTANKPWNALHSPTGKVFDWDEASTYIREPNFFDGCETPAKALEEIENAAVLGFFGDFITTDHISPAGVIPDNHPAANYLTDHGVEKKDFNSFGSRRGNHEIMARGTFGNIRIKNKLVDREGGFTIKDGKEMPIYTAAIKYIEEGKNLIVLAGQMYGAGSSRDWAAKGTNLQGVKAVIAESFERIHRSNLVGMGILPCEFIHNETAESLGLTGKETFTITGIAKNLIPRKILTVKADGKKFFVKARVDTPLEIEYLRNGGVLRYVLRNKM